MLQEQQLLRQLPQLPADVLPRVLAHVPLQQRLGSCSLVSRSMRAAAVAATDTIQLPELTSQAKADALCAWLQRYGNQAVTRLEIDTPILLHHTVKLPLPWQELKQLQHLSLEKGPGLLLGLQTTAAGNTTTQQQQQQQQLAAAVSSKGVTTRRRAAAAAAKTAAAATASSECSGITLGALATLTSLKMYCHLPISYSTTRRIFSQLRTLTQLRSLELGSLGHAVTTFYEHTPEDDAALGEVIGQLVLLTRLDVSAAFDGRVLAAASNLRHLKDLDVFNVGSAEHPVKLQNLPRSLVYLCLDEGTLDCAVDSSWQMPELRDLRVAEWQGVGFRLEVIARMPRLRWLDLSVEVLNAPPWGISDVVAMLPQLQHLQRLQLYGMQYWPAVAAAENAAAAAGTAAAEAAAAAADAEAAASCAALTASTNLMKLRLEDCRLPEGAVRHMFPASQWLPFLQVLDISCGEGTLEGFLFHEEPSNREVSSCSLVIKQSEDLSLLVDCCPFVQVK
jgi:hypothetical protein